MKALDTRDGMEESGVDSPGACWHSNALKRCALDAEDSMHGQLQHEQAHCLVGQHGTAASPVMAACIEAQRRPAAGRPFSLSQLPKPPVGQPHWQLVVGCAILASPKLRLTWECSKQD